MPRGIAIDWVAGNVYWTDSGRDVIEVAQMKGENRKTLISGMIDEPHAIVVDPLRGWARALGGRHLGWCHEALKTGGRLNRTETTGFQATPVLALLKPSSGTPTWIADLCFPGPP